MKTIFFGSMVMMLTAISANASHFQCFGVQNSKGARGVLTVSDTRDAYLNYTLNGKTKTCRVAFDSSYKPRAANPQQDRYVFNTTEDSNNCGKSLYIWMSKSILNSNKGFVDVAFVDGYTGDGEGGYAESMVCNKQN